MKKTEGRKSRDTVPLSEFILFLKENFYHGMNNWTCNYKTEKQFFSLRSEKNDLFLQRFASTENERRTIMPMSPMR
jgi:hypothetical protein